jgi:methyl-accepting chemotaxis protein
MKWKDLNLRFKIGIGFGLIILFATIISIVDYINITGIQGETKSLSEKYIPAINETQYLDKNWREVVQYLQSYNDNGNNYNIIKAKQKLANFKSSLDILLKVSDGSKKLENAYKNYLLIQVSIEKFSNLLDEYEKVVTITGSKLRDMSISSKNIEFYTLKKFNGQNNYLNNLYSRILYLDSHIFSAVYQKLPADLVKIKPTINEYLIWSKTFPRHGGQSGQVLDTSILTFNNAIKEFSENYSLAKKLELSNDELTNNISWLIRETSDVGIDQVKEMGENINSTIQKEKVVIFILILVLLISGIAFASIITYSMTRTINNAIDSALQMSNGDLSKTLRSEGNDEIGKLVNALNKLNLQMKEIIIRIIENSDILTTSSKDLSAKAIEISDGAKLQASAAEEIASSMEEIY